MALQYGLNNAVDFESSKIVSFASVLSRTAGQPMDKSQLWYPLNGKTGYERACEYAATASAYVGQELAVVDVVYEEDGTTVKSTSVKFYGIQDAEGTLKELGAVPVGDESTIEVDGDGKISLKGVSEQIFERDILGDDGEPTGQKEQIKYQPLLTSEGLIWVEPSKTTVEGLATLIEALNSTVSQLSSEVKSNTSAITSEAQAREAADKAITDSIGTIEEGKTVVGMIEAALEAAKQYADENDSVYDDTAVKARIKTIEDDYLKTADKYDDTQVKADIKAVADRVGPIETAIGDGSGGIIKDIADNKKAIEDEAKARTQGDSDTLNSAKAYTDEEIVGLDIAIEKKTVGEVESDYIVIKNKAGAEVASVNAAKFVKDGMLDKAEYSTATKKLTLTWNTDAGKNATEIDLNDLVNTYTGSEHVIVGTDGVITLADDVVLDSDIEALSTALDNKFRTESQVNAQIDAKIETANLSQYAVKSEVETELDKKADKEAFESHVETYGEFVEAYNTTKETFATKTDLENKVDVSTYEADMAKVAKTEAVNGQFNSIGQRIDLVEESIETNAAAVTETLKEYAKTSEVATTLENYYAKSEVYTKGETDNKIDAKIASVTGGESAADVKSALESYRDALNKEIWGDDAGGWTTTVDTDGKTKVVYDPKYGNNSRIDVLENKVSQIESTNEAQTAAIDSHSTAIGNLETGVNNLQTGLNTVSNSYTTLNTKVTTDIDPRLEALEGIVKDETTGLVAVVAGHTSKISSLEAKDTELANKIQANTDKFADYQTKADAEAQHTELSNAIKNVDLTSRVSVTDFEAYKTNVSTELSKKAVATEVAASFEAVNTEVAKKADKDTVYDKTTAEATFVKSADFEALVDARVNTLIGGANAEDTITNVTNLIEFVNNNAGTVAQLVTDVKAHGDAISAQADLIEANDTAIKANTAAIEALGTTVTNGLAGVTVHESTEISVATRTGDGKTGVELGIKEVNVNKLVQTAEDILILNGGSATV